MIDRIDELFRQQIETWPLLKKGVVGLDAAQTRRVEVDGHEILVRHIPHRATSTTAPVDRESVSKRPCFLCPENLDPLERGLPFTHDYTIYCNPFPILERHLTIVHRAHRPQRIEGEIGAVLDLAEALPGLFVIYNGPECGASAPDHMHLQAGSREGLPIVREIARTEGPVLTDHGKKALVFRNRERGRLMDELGDAISRLSSVTGRSREATEPTVPTEPWLNLAVYHESGREFTAVLYPRGKHRPDVFHSGELTVSPATIDLSGILVVPVAEDFARISGRDISSIFREVSLPDEQFERLVRGC